MEKYIDICSILIPYSILHKVDILKGKSLLNTKQAKPSKSLPFHDNLNPGM